MGLGGVWVCGVKWSCHPKLALSLSSVHVVWSLVFILKIKTPCAQFGAFSFGFHCSCQFPFLLASLFPNEFLLIHNQSGKNSDSLYILVAESFRYGYQYK